MEVLHYNLDMTPESEWKIVSAGAFARDNLLYLQEAGHFISGANYYTVRKELDSYLASVDAVIDGAQKRYEKSYSLLLEYIEENTATKTVETTFTLINDGASWKLEDAGTVFGQALFGTLSSSPVEDKQETNG